VAGLVSIFAAAVIPIIVMGVALEISKLIATVWLKLNWTRAPVFIRTYLLVAIAVLMLITSMGIFGFLSKAHSDAGLVSGDVMAKISVYDEKIKTAKDNIDANRKALKQMDEAVDQIMGRSSDEKGADKAVQIRRSQAKERGRLQAEIAAEQKTIASLNEARAPIAAEVRKVEAEVGPIKYIANFIYGDNPDANILEKAVTWVIIIIVSVFDPLAVILLLASQYSFQWFRQAREEQPAEGDSPPEPEPVVDNQPLTVTEQPVEDDFKFLAEYEPEPIPCVKCGTSLTEVPSIGLVCANPDCDPPVQEIIEEEKEEEKEDHEIMASAEVGEKTIMAAWKHDHPDSSLKLQRRLLERGLINKLPWENYLSPKADFIDEAAEEAAKWAEEQRTKAAGIGYMENVDGQQVKKTIEGYTQNAEQNESTIWQRVKKAKGE
jgi:Tfp pilus assembly protein PilO